MNYYCNMWERCSQTLAPLTKTTPSNMKFKGTKIEQDPFEENTQILVRDVLLAYLDFNEEFKIHTDASDFQLGAVISQNGKPMALYS